MAGSDDAICVPIRGQDEHVELRPSELPDDESSVAEMLMGEMAPLEVWRQVAVRETGSIPQLCSLRRDESTVGRALPVSGGPARLTALHGPLRPPAPPFRSPTTTSARRIR